MTLQGRHEACCFGNASVAVYEALRRQTLSVLLDEAIAETLSNLVKTLSPNIHTSKGATKATKLNSGGAATLREAQGPQSGRNGKACVNTR